MNPEVKVYCSDPWCDGDHAYEGETCTEPDSVPYPYAPQHEVPC